MNPSATPVPTLAAIVGPTGSGKHAVAILVAEALGAEIVNMDSMKVYRGMEIGSAIPSEKDLARVPHHLVRILDPWESYSAARFVEDATRVVAEIRMRGKRPMLVGGTVLYLKTFLHGLFRGPSADLSVRAELEAVAKTRGPEALHAELERVDPEAARRLHPNDLRRVVRALEVHRKTGVPISRLQAGSFKAPPREACLIAALRRDRAAQYARIADRVDVMLKTGLVEEVRHLLAHPKGMSREALQGHGYKELVPFLEGRETLAQGREATIRNTKYYSRKQLTWLRGFGDAVTWVDIAEGETTRVIADRVIAAARGDRP
jgi:tRNA dimethylallyltransferase